MDYTKRIAWRTALAGIAMGIVLPAMAQLTPPADLMDRVASAKTRADHEAIAAEFEKLAVKDRAEAERHRKMAALYKTPAWSKASGAGMIKHCESLARSYESAAADFTEMAKAHRAFGAKIP